MEVLHSSVDNLQFLNYALRVGFVDWENSNNWAWIVMNIALFVTVLWAIGISWWMKHAQSRPVFPSTATEIKGLTGKESTSASTGITEGNNRSMCDFSQGRIYKKCEGSLVEFSSKQGSCAEETEVSRGRNPVINSCSSADNTFSEGKCLGFVYSIDMSCSRDNVISVWNNGVGKCIHDTKLDEYPITVEGNCLFQNSPKSVLLSRIMQSGEEKAWLCLLDRRQPVKALSLSLGDELLSLHAVEFNDTKICFSNGLNDKLFDLRMAASPVVELYPTPKRMEGPIGRQNQSAKAWNYLEGLVLENTASRRGIMEWRTACISCSGSLRCILK